MRRFPLVLTLGTMAWFAGGQSAWANPNMVKNGDFEQPTTLAESRLSPTENEVIFEIPGPNGFGRVIARGQDVGRDLQKTLKVGYLRPGGSSPGLMIDASDVKARGSYEISVWLDLLGQIRPNRQYAYAITCPPAGQNKPAPALEMMAPAIWADGKLMGAKVNLVWGKEKNQTADSVVKRGVVKTPDFKYQTGGQALVLKLPRDFKEQLYISRASFRELNPDILAGKNPKMPTPTRYITIDNVIEEDVASALVGATRALQQTQSPNGFWQAGGVDESVELTANIISTLARRGVDLDTRPMRKGMDWLAEQEPTKTSALAARIELFCPVCSGQVSPDHRGGHAAPGRWPVRRRRLERKLRGRRTERPQAAYDQPRDIHRHHGFAGSALRRFQSRSEGLAEGRGLLAKSTSAGRWVSRQARRLRRAGRSHHGSQYRDGAGGSLHHVGHGFRR
jgi:hypothetical protein